MKTAIAPHVDATAREAGARLIEKAREAVSGLMPFVFSAVSLRGRKTTALSAAYMLREMFDRLSPDERATMRDLAVEIIAVIKTWEEDR